MSARPSLTLEELEDMFPTVYALVCDCGENDRTKWGLRQHKKKKDRTSYGYEDKDWDLIVSLDDIFLTTGGQYVNTSSDDLFLFHGFNSETQKLSYEVISHGYVRYLHTTSRSGMFHA